MSLTQHTIEVPDGAEGARTDRTILGVLTGVANAAGGAAGAAVTTAVALPSTANLPAAYAVHISPGQDATWYITNKTATGFDVVLTPRLAANTLAAGTFDCTIHA